MPHIYPCDGGSVEVRPDAFGARLVINTPSGHASVVLRDYERDALIRVLALRTTDTLSRDEWDRVLGLLHYPTPPGPLKDMDERIIDKINHARGQ